MAFSLMGLIIPSGNTLQCLIKLSIIIIFLNYIKHVNAQGIEPSYSVSDQMRFDKLVAVDSFNEV